MKSFWILAALVGWIIAWPRVVHVARLLRAVYEARKVGFEREAVEIKVPD